MTSSLLSVSLGAAVTVLLCAQSDPEDIFIEAETSPEHTFNGAAKFENVVSGGQILRLWKEADPPAEGYVARFPFTVGRAGDHFIWLSASLPPATSNFWWRLDGGGWTHCTEESGDEAPVAMYGVSKVMSWVRLATADLSSGPHALSIRVNERRHDNERAYLLYLDAILVTTRDVWPRGLVTPADVAKLGPRPVPPRPVPRAGNPGSPMELGTSVMGARENRLVKGLGFSHSQTDSDHLTVNETAPGAWDWTEADKGLAAARKAGLKWQYFPHFHWPPEWYRKGPRFVPSVGLRTKRTLACMSLWSPDILPWFEHGYAALAQRYGSGDDPVYAIYLGIHGDFGETIFPMGWHPDEAKRFGVEGAGKPDFWCGDEHARAGFRRRARQKYGTLEELNAAWGTGFASLDAVDYPPAAYRDADVRGSAPSRRYWLDFVGWYCDSMTAFTGEVCRIARRHFPRSLLQLPVGGGSENLMYGQDTTAIPKVARAFGVHVRSTHGGYAPFAEGYAAMIKRIATPCKVYGAPHWLEPPGAITPEGEVSRIMEALSCGNWGYWDWGSNPAGAADVFREYARFLTREKPVVDVALFFPTTDHRLQRRDFPPRLAGTGKSLRDVLDFDMVDEELIADDGLKEYRVLAWLEGTFIEKAGLERIARWVEGGGVVVRYGADDILTVEGDSQRGRELMGLPAGTTLQEAAGKEPELHVGFLRHVRAHAGAKFGLVASGVDPKAVSLAAFDGRPAAWARPHGKGWVIVWARGKDDPAERRTFCELLRDAAYGLSGLDASKGNAREVDADWDEVYATLLENGEVLLLNGAGAPRTKKVGESTITLPPKSLRSAMAGGKSP